MKYRIKIVTYKNGRKEYFAQVKRLFWKALTDSGNIALLRWPFDSREEALRAIDKHYHGNHSLQSITFEYITK